MENIKKKKDEPSRIIKNVRHSFQLAALSSGFHSAKHFAFVYPLIYLLNWRIRVV